jgi:hypothetical protein
MEDYFKELGEIYESLEFQSSYDNHYDPHLEKVKTEANAICSYIEKYLKGTINYYQNTKEDFFNDPSNMRSLQDLKG